MNRYQAAGLHLLGSFSVLLIVFFAIHTIWYPGQLFSAAAGGELFRLLAGVDVILGPLVMLIIFDAKKKYLKLDIGVILICQLVFLGYGVWSIFSARPVYIAFVENRFCLVRANEIETADLAKAKDPQFKALPLFGPVYVGTQQPADQKERENILFGGFGGMGIQNLPQYFVPYAQVQQQILAAAKDSQQLKGVDSETRVKLQNYEKAHATDSVRFLMLINKKIPLIAVINSKSAEVIEFI